MSRYAAVMGEHAEAAQAGWREGQQLDIAEAMTRLTLGIVGRTLFDADLLDRADTLRQNITTLQSALSLQMRVPFRLPWQGKANAALGSLNETIYRMIRDRRASGLDKGDLTLNASVVER